MASVRGGGLHDMNRASDHEQYLYESLERTPEKKKLQNNVTPKRVGSVYDNFQSKDVNIASG